MKKFLLILIICAIMHPSISYPKEYKTNKGYPVCTTKKSYKEAIGAVIAKDMQWFNSISGCIITTNGLKVTIIDWNMRGGSNVRIYPSGGGKPFSLWTSNEAFD